MRARAGKWSATGRAEQDHPHMELCASRGDGPSCVQQGVLSLRGVPGTWRWACRGAAEVHCRGRRGMSACLERAQSNQIRSVDRLLWVDVTPLRRDSQLER